MSQSSGLSTIIEALLFVAGEPLAVVKLADLSGHSVADVTAALVSLEQSCAERGIRLLKQLDTATLVTAPHLSGYVEKLIKEELLGDISKAALDTLTIIAYRHPIARVEIDYIRGVNSSFTLRNLMARGLAERIAAPEGRGYLYRPTIEFMKYLGLTSFHELPEYDIVQKELSKGLEEKPEEGHH